MSNPTSYVVGYSFSGYQANNPTTPLPAPALDTELSNIQTSVKSLVSSVTDIRRADGALKNGVVTLDSLSQSIALMFDAGTMANATLLANAVASAAASATGAAASLAAAQAIPATDPALLFAGAVLADETVILSAATTDIGAATTTRIRVDHNVTITSLGVVPNRLRFVRFTGALTLTHNATSFALVNGVSRAVSPGDQSVFMSDSSGNWREFDASGIEAPGMAPLGGTLIWWDDVLPTSGLWAWANGSTVSASQVAPQLLARWGNKFGGDGVTTMGLPDLRDTVPVGKSTIGGVASRALQTLTNTVLGALFGEANHTLITAEIPAVPFSGTTGSENTSHTHAGGSAATQNEFGGTNSGSQVTWGGGPQSTGGESNNHQHAFSGTISGGHGPHNNVQPSTTCNYIVRIA
jgi:microcystin-dependent protein